MEQTAVTRASLNERFEAFLIDTLIFGLITFFIALPLTNGIENAAVLLVFILNGLFFLKDITGQSPGKRLVKIRIVHKETHQTPNPIILFVRNLFLCLGVIELAVMYSDKNHERIGDKVTNTMVVKTRTNS